MKVSPFVLGLLLAISPGYIAIAELPTINVENEKQLIPSEAYDLAVEGYSKLLQDSALSKTGFITIVDFTKPSTEKRMWVVDLNKNEVIYESLVAHGKNSGSLYAKQFSNTKGSYQSSLGFYKTAETYKGKHGYSLNLDGLEKGINDNARDRRIVIHGAEYVSEDWAKKYGRIGRSFGCPALPEHNYSDIIDYIKEGSCLFIYHNEYSYIEKSSIVGCTN